MWEFLKSTAGRTWLYTVCIAALPVGIAAGVLTKESAALVVPLIVALLNVHPKDAATGSSSSAAKTRARPDDCGTIKG